MTTMSINSTGTNVSNREALHGTVLSSKKEGSEGIVPAVGIAYGIVYRVSGIRTNISH